jgi:probable rRNA maturation factor
VITLEIDNLELVGHAGAEGWLLGQGRRALEEIANRFGARGDVRVRLVGDEEMAAVHARTMNIPDTTDVLTFDVRDEGADERDIDADIFVCVDEAGRQARGRGHPLEREALLYIVHGVLHCLPGFDDVDEDDARRMHDVEDEILRAIGVGDVFRG